MAGSGSELEASGVRLLPLRGKVRELTRLIQLATTLQGHVDDIRTLIQCGICIRPLYEPFTLACGHTFCYSVRILPSGRKAKALIFPSASYHGFPVDDPSEHARTAGHPSKHSPRQHIL
jgi:hypothetical protein